MHQGFELSVPMPTRALEFVSGFRHRGILFACGPRELMVGQDETCILVVEDEAIIALEMESLLKQASCVVIACGSVQSALRQASERSFDAAVLDVNLHGEMSFPIADALAAKNVPFIFVSGYEVEIVPRHHRRRPFVGKPYLSQKFLTTLFDAMKNARPLATSA